MGAQYLNNKINFKDAKFYFPLIITSFGFLIYVLKFSPLELYKDEQYFYPIAERIASLKIFDFWLGIKNYEVPIAPLSFVVSGIFLKMYHSIILLRIVNIIYYIIFSYLFISMVTAFKIVNVFKKFLIIFLIVFNPYIFLITPFYYTDCLYLLAVCIFLYFVRTPHKSLTWGALLVLPTIRQIGVLYIVSMCCYELINKSEKFSLSLKKSFLWGLSSIGILILIWYWGGISPSVDFNLKNIAIKEKYGSFRIDYLIFYCSAISFYLFPVICLKFKKLYRSKLYWLGFAFGIGIFYFFTPTKNFYHDMDTFGQYNLLLIKVFGEHFYKIPMGFLAAFFTGYLSNLFFDKVIHLYLRL